MTMDKVKKKRLDKILELIKKNEIETQGELAQMLRESGFKVTQGTVSRDVRELGLTKTTASSEGRSTWSRRLPTRSSSGSSG